MAWGGACAWKIMSVVDLERRDQCNYTPHLWGEVVQWVGLNGVDRQAVVWVHGSEATGDCVRVRAKYNEQC